MAYLPTVNEIKGEPVSKEDITQITKGLVQRFKSLNVPSAFLSKTSLKEKNVTVEKDESMVSVLENLYRFIVQDTFESEKNLKVEEKRTENLEEQEDDRMVQTMTAVAVSEEPEEEEGIIHRLWRYFKYFTMGKFVYKHWEDIEKFLGIEGLGKSIKSISDDIGLSGVIERIQNTVNDILKAFSEKTGINFGGESDYVSDGLTKSERAKEAMKFFISKGWTKEQAAGIVGNLMVESGGFDEEVISGRKKGDNGQAVGIAQWHADRQGEFKKVMGKPVVGSSFKDQLEFVNYELTQGTEKEAGKEIKKTTSAEQAAKVTDVAYERSSGEAINKRVGYAKELSTQDLTTESSTNTSTPVQSTNTTTTESSPKPLAFKQESPKSVISSGIDQPKDLVFASAPTRIPKSETTQEKNELGDTSSSKDIPNTIQGLATDEDLRNLDFKHTEQKAILKVFAKKLQELRTTLGYNKFIVLSGYRNPEYNDAVGGAKDSCHTKRIAADIVVAPDSAERVRFIRAASRLGFGGIGVYKSFIHVDLGKRRTWPTNYKPSQDIIDALRDHVNQTTPQEKYDIPLLKEAENGEKGYREAGKAIPESLGAEEGSEHITKDIFEEGMEGLNKITSMITGYAEQFNGMEFKDIYKKLEPYMSKNTQVPRKEQTTPSLQSPTIINNNIQTNVVNKNYTTTEYDKSIDKSPLDRK